MYRNDHFTKPWRLGTKMRKRLKKGVLCRRSCCIDCPDPMVKNETCAADVRSLCRADSYAQKYAMVYGFSPGCGKKTALFEPFIYIKDHFTKSGSG